MTEEFLPRLKKSQLSKYIYRPNCKAETLTTFPCSVSGFWVCQAPQGCKKQFHVIDEQVMDLHLVTDQWANLSSTIWEHEALQEKKNSGHGFLPLSRQPERSHLPAAGWCSRAFGHEPLASSAEWGEHSLSYLLDPDIVWTWTVTSLKDHCCIHCVIITQAQIRGFYFEKVISRVKANILPSSSCPYPRQVGNWEGMTKKSIDIKIATVPSDTNLRFRGQHWCTWSSILLFKYVDMYIPISSFIYCNKSVVSLWSNAGISCIKLGWNRKLWLLIFFFLHLIRWIREQISAFQVFCQNAPNYS